MSLYNMLFGQNPASDLLLAILGLTKDDVGRFRDCFVVMEEGTPRIAVYTRNGGGNRKCWAETGKACGTCCGCIISDVLPTHPLYISDSDDDFDCTYATILFRVPEFATDLLREHAGETPPPKERWRALFARMDSKDAAADTDPDLVRARTVGAALFEKLKVALEGGDPIVLVDDGGA